MLLRPSWMLLRVVLVFHGNEVVPCPVPAVWPGVNNRAREHHAHLGPDALRRRGKIRGGQPLEVETGILAVDHRALPGDGYGREPREAAVDDVAQVTLAVLSVEVVRASQDLQGGVADRVVAGLSRCRRLLRVSR